jgi:hypothetical protein
MLAPSVLGIQLAHMIIGGHDMQEFHPAKKRVEVSVGESVRICHPAVLVFPGWEVPLMAEETTSHPTRQPKDGCQVVGYAA